MLDTFRYPIPWQDMARASGALAVSAPEIAVPATIGVGSAIAVGGLLYYGSCWAMQDMGPAYEISQPSGSMGITHPMAGSTTLQINTSLIPPVAGQPATPGGDPNDPLRSFKSRAERYQYRTSGTRFNEEPYLDVQIHGETRTLRPDNIANGYIHESKWMDPSSNFYMKQFGGRTGLEWHVAGKNFSGMVQKYSLAAEQNGLVGIKVYISRLDAVQLARQLYASFSNVEFIFVP